LALIIENLVLNFWTCKNGTVGTSLAPLAGRWHVFFFFLMYYKISKHYLKPYLFVKGPKKPLNISVERLAIIASIIRERTLAKRKDFIRALFKRINK
jgi:hypothetical protein